MNVAFGSEADQLYQRWVACITAGRCASSSRALAQEGAGWVPAPERLMQRHGGPAAFDRGR
jgi:hypothetical protein